MKTEKNLTSFLAMIFVSLLLLGAAKRNDQILGGDSMKFVVLLIVAAMLIVGAFLLGSRLRTGEQALELDEVKAQNLKLLDEKATLVERLNEIQEKMRQVNEDNRNLLVAIERAQGRTEPKAIEGGFPRIERPAAQDFETVPRTAPDKTKK